MSFRTAILATLALLCALSFAPLCQAAKPKTSKPKAADLEFFEKKIRPVLVQHCYECHSEQSKIVKANLLLDTREGTLRGGDSGAAIVPGDGDGSLLVEALKQEGLEMPPSGKLSDEVIADFIKWIDLGAPDPRDGKARVAKGIDLEKGREHWAYRAPKLTPLKPINRSWPRGEIDRYVLFAMEDKAELSPVADAPKHLLIRRLYLDLIGLPPTPEEIAAFEADTSEQATERLVDRLLSQPQFGEKWGRHWLDVARYAESSGKERNVPYRMAWRYRDYVIDAFNADMPYDQFVREQLAGDLLPHQTDADRDRQLIATGFLAVGPRALTERVTEQYLMDVADEQLDTTTRVFLASTAGCARCHDHKFDPIPTTDYYALAGIFRSSEELVGVTPLRREFSYARAAALSGLSEDDSSKYQQEIARLEKELDGKRNDMRAANKTKDKKKIADSKEKEAATLAELTALRAKAETEQPGDPRFAMIIRDRAKVADCAVRIRGEVADLGPVVPRGYLSVVQDVSAPKIAAQQSGRLQLAEWIASPSNPLTARVLVNRVWLHLFGRGLVESCDNFGILAEAPSHPELLDYLALRFMDQKWSTKRLIREIVLSRTYQLSSEPNKQAYAVDPGNKLLWRFSRRRLEAEMLRDAILAVGGQLDLKRPLASASLTVVNVELGSSARSLGTNDSFLYRAVYLPMLRGCVPEMLGLFDMADPSLVTGQREVTTVATQSLYLMNSKFVLDKAARLAKRLLEQTHLDENARVDLAYRITLARLPTDSERRQVLDFVAGAAKGSSKEQLSEVEAWADVCQSLIASGEFLYLH